MSVRTNRQLRINDSRMTCFRIVAALLADTRTYSAEQRAVLGFPVLSSPLGRAHFRCRRRRRRSQQSLPFCCAHSAFLGRMLRRQWQAAILLPSSKVPPSTRGYRRWALARRPRNAAELAAAEHIV